MDQYLQITLEGAVKLVDMWELFDYTEKQRLQNLVFPSGMKYNRKNDEVRTDDVNPMLAEIARLAGTSEQKETGQTNTQIDLSGQVGSAGQV